MRAMRLQSSCLGTQREHAHELGCRFHDLRIGGVQHEVGHARSRVPYAAGCDRPAAIPVACREIAQTTGVALKARPAVMHGNVTVLANNRPAGELLGVLARTLGCAWLVTREPGSAPAYELYRTAAAARATEEDKER